MKGRNIAGFACLLILAGFIAAIYLGQGRLSRDELWLAGGLLVTAMMLFDPEDTKSVLLAVGERFGLKKPPTPPAP